MLKKTVFYFKLCLYKLSNLKLVVKFLPDRYLPFKYFGGIIYLNPKESEMMRQRALGIYEYEKTNYLKKILKPNMTFFDIGANKGYFTLIAARILGGSGKIYSFEPIRENLRWLKMSVKRNDYKNVRIIPKAVSDENTESYIYKGRTSGNSSLIKDKGLGKFKVETITLDHLKKNEVFDRVDIIKIDVEGAEMKLLRGAKDLLKTYHPIIIMDLHDIDRVKLKSLLESLSYELFTNENNYSNKLNIGETPVINKNELIAIPKKSN